MEQIKQLIGELVAAGSLRQATLSNPRHKDPGQASKVTVRPVLLKERQVYQFAYQVGPKVLHDNLEPAEAAEKLGSLLAGTFKQGLLQAEGTDYQVLVNKKGKATVLKKEGRASKGGTAVQSHNRKKNYLLEEGTPVPFLVELGVMTPEGKVVAAKYDKFRQINRFLELIDDVVAHLPKDRPVRVIDFGCGKSYLTFALHHLLQGRLPYPPRIEGLDLKEDVIAHCSLLAEKLGCEGLRFQVGDIGRYEETDAVDLVVTLHACDTATDAALEKAVRWGAKVILSVPCCQHELFAQVSSEALAPLLRHGILKERFASLATDAARAQLLELSGYRTQLVEFIDLEHTPKNLLIRAVYQGLPDDSQRSRLEDDYRSYRDALHIRPYLERALADRLPAGWTGPEESR
ncbi:methyltransferase [Paenibacillus sp. J31TS4]|uniref:class I SAM-dependent methyltransferase n=1 Tax=Paenibacillus sp. J31TS4 TaxID=2807195 RepID=UPI001B26B592|nr:SAM-dependent methyltransferase [Paenibacillus sp. J31TS4]GIP40001.1 methyltransferase [Paenibacillus sp. J31TS4]